MCCGTRRQTTSAKLSWHALHRLPSARSAAPLLKQEMHEHGACPLPQIQPHRPTTASTHALLPRALCRRRSAKATAYGLEARFSVLRGHADELRQVRGLSWAWGEVNPNSRTGDDAPGAGAGFAANPKTDLKRNLRVCAQPDAQHQTRDEPAASSGHRISHQQETLISHVAHHERWIWHCIHQEPRSLEPSNTIFDVAGA